MTTDQIIELAIQGHASTRDAIKWAIEQERNQCANLADAELLDTALLMSYPPKSSAAWNIGAAIRARSKQ